MSEASSALRQATQGTGSAAPLVHGTQEPARSGTSEPARFSQDVLSQELNTVCSHCGSRLNSGSVLSRTAAYSGALEVPRGEPTPEILATGSSSTSGKKRRSPKSQTEKFHDVMGMFGKKAGLTLAEFFKFLFDPESELLNPSETATLTAWLAGGTTSGYRLVELVASIKSGFVSAGI
ncbi:hypothetical protein FRC07_005941 [Ceratobasidium sp. 392]|nr:hypothetical protein FRC07_005941 [Ceratobasidium sp. 392]